MTRPAGVPAGLRRRRRLDTGQTSTLGQPARLIGAAFLLLIGVGTLLLMLPVSSAGPGGTDLTTALFTATSAACVTGLVTVDTATYWTGFGQGVLLGLMQLGGLGLMTFASLLGLLVVGRLGLRSRLLPQAETRSGLGTVGQVVRGIVRVSLVVEAVVWAALTLRFHYGYGQSAGQAAYFGLFHTISAYNNAGFGLWSDSLIGAATDPWILLPIAAAFILGGIGYPVMLEVTRRMPRPREWSLHTRLTLWTTGILLVVGPLVVTLTEWSNADTLGSLDTGGRLLSGWFSGVSPRTAGFNTIDYAQADAATLLTTDALMIVGGGSAGTAGGIKVTTLAVLVLAVLSEARGDMDVDAFGRRIAAATIRQALAVASLAFLVVTVATILILELTELGLDAVLFEVVSAFATVGLSTGITDDLPAAGQYVLIVLMFLGRVGPITAATALALRSRSRAYRNPEGRPIVG